MNFKFSNILGVTYKKGNMLFGTDDVSLLSIIGNRIKYFDLKNRKSKTLSVESKYNYVVMDLSPKNNIILAANEEGELHVISLKSYSILSRHRLVGNIQVLKFSPDGKFVVVCKDTNVYLYEISNNSLTSLHPLILRYVFTSSSEERTCISWTDDSKFFAVGSASETTFVYSCQKSSNYKGFLLSGSHRDSIVNCFFEKNSLDLLTICRNGQLCFWDANMDADVLENACELNSKRPPKRQRIQSRVVRDDDNGDPDIIINNAEELIHDEDMLRKIEAENGSKNDKVTAADQKPSMFMYKKNVRHFLADEVRKDAPDAYLTSAAYDRNLKVLVCGFSIGAFFIYQLPDVTLFYSLQVFESPISSISLNWAGNLVALSSSDLGQILIWSWTDESMVLRQQGHANGVYCVAHSFYGDYVATGSTDGAVKLWDVASGFCIVTFNEHTETVSDIVFCRLKKVVVSASLDGTVRAFDTVRYRNFRIFTTPQPTQFSCVAVDSTSEFVVAASMDTFDIYLWRMKTGELLEVMRGHSASIASLSFSPVDKSSTLISTSWDKTVKIWSAIEKLNEHESIELISEGLCCDFRSDGEEIAVATLNGHICFFETVNASQVTYIDGGRDLDCGVSETDLVSAKQNQKARAFTTICYSADGKYLLAGGQSKNICIYHIGRQILIKKFTITQNYSLDRVNDFINRRYLTEFGNLKLIEERNSLEEESKSLRLPGVRRHDKSLRNIKPEVRVFRLQFSPAGQSFVGATTEGVLIYSMNVELFDPWQLEVCVDPQTVITAMNNKEYSTALIMALKLNIFKYLANVIELTPASEIKLVVDNLAPVYLEKILIFLPKIIEKRQNLHLYVIWSKMTLIRVCKCQVKLEKTTFMNMMKCLYTIRDNALPMYNSNKHTSTNLLMIHDMMQKMNID